MGLPTVETGISNAASWNGPTIPVRFIQLRDLDQYVCKKSGRAGELNAPERPALPRLVLAHVTRNLVERFARLKPLERLLRLAGLLAKNVPKLSGQQGRSAGVQRSFVIQQLLQPPIRHS